MLMDVRSPRFRLTAAILSYVECKLAANVGFARLWVRDVSVTLDDVNAGRGGVDKLCRVVIRCRGNQSVVAEARDPDLYAAVDAAAARARRGMVDLLGRSIDRQRQDRQRPGVMVSL